LDAVEVADATKPGEAGDSPKSVKMDTEPKEQEADAAQEPEAFDVDKKSQSTKKSIRFDDIDVPEVTDKIETPKNVSADPNDIDGDGQEQE